MNKIEQFRKEIQQLYENIHEKENNLGSVIYKELKNNDEFNKVVWKIDLTINQLNAVRHIHHPKTELKDTYFDKIQTDYHQHYILDKEKNIKLIFSDWDFWIDFNTIDDLKDFIKDNKIKHLDINIDKNIKELEKQINILKDKKQQIEKLLK